MKWNTEMEYLTGVSEAQEHLVPLGVKKQEAKIDKKKLL